MEKRNDRLTIKDLHTALICVVIVASALILPRLEQLNLWGQFTNLVEVNSVNYPHYDPPIFFSMGEALAALAILFAVFEFNKDRWRLALKIRSYITPVVLGLFSLGFIFSIYSSTLGFSDAPVTLFQLSIFWQILSAVFIAGSIVFLLWRARTKNLFNSISYKKFYDVLYWETSRPDSSRLDLTLNVLLDNFKNICESVVAADSEMSRYAKSILNVILSDRSMVNLLATKRLDGILYILAVAKKYSISSEESHRGIPLMIQGLFYNPESFLYKHLDDSGLALSSNIYESLFDSPIILSNFDVFGYPTLGFSARGSIDSGAVKVFIESVSRSILTYLKTGTVPVRHITNGITYLGSIFSEICSKIAIEQKAGKEKQWDPDGNWWLLHSISYFFGHDYAFIGDKEITGEKKEELDTHTVEREKSAKKANPHSHLAINEAIASAIYKALEDLSRIDNKDDTYNLVLNLLHGMQYLSGKKRGYILPFEERIWVQIGRNVLGKYYPLVLNSYLQYIGLCAASDDKQGKGWSDRQAERMRRLLYIDLAPKLDAGEKMVDDTLMKDVLLPDCMDYKDRKFTYTMGFGRGPTKVIDPPPSGSESALKYVDWQNFSEYDY